MRDRPVLVFFAGFACGLLFLAFFVRRPAPLPASVPASSANSKLVQGATPRANGTSDASGPHGLIIPVTGVAAADLRDNFDDKRTDHKHEALDIMAARGTPVIAAVEGSVAKLFLSKPGGLTVYQFDNSRTNCYYYAHLDSYAPGLKEGMLLHKGDVLGYVGSTGNASAEAPHLHFAIFVLGPEKHWWEGTPINPYPLLGGAPERLK